VRGRGRVGGGVGGGFGAGVGGGAGGFGVGVGVGVVGGGGNRIDTFYILLLAAPTSGALSGVDMTLYFPPLARFTAGASMQASVSVQD
jgi:hypothetical protein